MRVWDMLLWIEGWMGSVFRETGGDENRCSTSDGTDRERGACDLVRYGSIDAQHGLLSNTLYCNLCVELFREYLLFRRI